MKIYRTLVLAAVCAFSAIAAEVSLIDMMPADATAIGGIHADRVASSPFGQFLLTHFSGHEADLEKLITATGFDPRRDLRDVVFASTAAGKNSSLVLARGVFNGPQIISALRLKDPAIKVSTWAGVDVADSPDGQHSIAITDGSLAFAGEPALVRAALDSRSGAPASATLKVKAATVSTQYDAWMVTSGTMKNPLAAAGKSFQGLNTKAIVESSGGLTFGSVVQFAGQAVTRSDKDAQALVDVVKFLSGMVQLNGGDNPDLEALAPVLETLQIRAAANVVTLSFSIPQADLERFMQPRKKLRVAHRASR